MESIWQKTAEIPEREALRGGIKTDTAVIGGGMAGILTAWLLRQAGVETVVLEAGRVAGGQTGRTTAKITSQHGPIYQRLLDGQGAQAAGQYARMNQQAVEEYARIIEEKGIDCQFTRLPAWLYAQTEAGAETLRREREAAEKAGVPAVLTHETELPIKVSAALRFDNQARFHPLLFLRALAEELPIYEQSPVERVEGTRLYTPEGEVEARRVVFACHYPFINAPGYFFMRMHQARSYCLALEKGPRLQGMYLGVDPDGLSFRSWEDTLLLGGGGHRTGENRGGGKYEMLERQAASLWPESRQVARWSAQDCMTLDGAPYIGHFSPAAPYWYVATGFGKWGMTGSMVAAMILRDLLIGKENPDREVFDPGRFTPSASAKAFLADGLHAVRDLSRRVFTPGRAELDALPVGHGGVVEYDGEKVGAYKDQQGRVFLVSVKCPHLGCQLEWNPDEKSWDCPCHGSRFDYTGRLLDRPAQTGLR